MDLQLTDARVLITGSSRGIGLAIARAFLAEGAHVLLTGRCREVLDAEVGKLRADFGEARVRGAAGDLTQSAVIAETLAAAEAAWGGLDVLVLNVGSGRSAAGLDADPAEWTRVLDLNLISAMEMLRQAAPGLRAARHPAVVFVGSIAGREDIGAPIAYAAAKAALTQAMKTAARLLGRDGIRVNMVAPGNIYCEGGTWAAKLAADRARVTAMLHTEVPLARLGTTEEVAAVVVFLAGRLASFVTGACVTVDGGQTRAT